MQGGLFPAKDAIHRLESVHIYWVMIMEKLTGNEYFSYDDKPTGKLLADFWAWNSSDLLNNTLRGALAEFIVATALDLNTDICREDWAAYDLETPSGIKIEVKSSAYLQSWNNDRISDIRFGIQPTKAWDAKAGYSEEVKRQSDVYDFCVYASKEKKDSPLQLDRWEFYVLPTAVHNRKCGKQKSISLNSLLALNPQKSDYINLGSVVNNILL